MPVHSALTIYLCRYYICQQAHLLATAACHNRINYNLCVINLQVHLCINRIRLFDIVIRRSERDRESEGRGREREGKP